MKSKLANITNPILLGIVISVAMLITFSYEYSEQELQMLEYCEMVRLHKLDPEVGWPDYKGIYDKECPQTKARKTSV